MQRRSRLALAFCWEQRSCPGRWRHAPTAFYDLSRVIAGCCLAGISDLQPESRAMIENAVIVITGASSGMGEAAARYLAARGAKVVLGARNEGKLHEIVDQIRMAGGDATCLETDVVSLQDNQDLAAHAVDTFGRLDVFVANAGSTRTPRRPPCPAALTVGIPVIGWPSCPVVVAIRMVPAFSVMSNRPSGRPAMPHGLLRAVVRTLLS